MIKKLLKNYGGLGLVCVALGAGTSAVNAEGTISPEKIVTAPTAYPGKIVVVDKTANSFTVEIQGQLYLFKATAQTRLLRNGKLVEFKDLTPGQEVTLVIQQAASGEIQVVSLTVDNNQSEVEAAGQTKPVPNDNSSKPTKKPVPGAGVYNSPNPPSRSPVVSPFN